jgi:catechol 2,3-dioxygenase-like lactoylglutathione lyase family enzyme
MIKAVGITHVALELSSPTRTERYLRDVFGLQLLAQGYLRGEYVRAIGSPHHPQGTLGFLILYNRPFIPIRRFRHIGIAVEGDVEAAVVDLRRRGYDVDGEDIVTAPGGLKIKIDSFTSPRPVPRQDPVTKLQEVPSDRDLPCLVRRIHHVALDVADPAALLDWQEAVFGMDYRRHHDRRGEMISQIYDSDAPADAIGRKMSLLPLFRRAGVPRTELNHIAFDMADAEAAIGIIESRGAKVDLPQDAMIHGPEEVWYQIDSVDTPYPIDHPANQRGVTLIPYHNR